MFERQQEADVSTPVVARDAEAVDSKLVEERQDIPHQLVLLVAVLRDVGPPEAAEVRRDHTRVRRDERDHLAPQVPVLRPAVQKHDGVAFAGQRYVSAQAARVNELVLDACYVWDVAAHRALRYPRVTTSIRSVRTGRAAAVRGRSCPRRGPGRASRT